MAYRHAGIAGNDGLNGIECIDGRKKAAWRPDRRKSCHTWEYEHPPGVYRICPGRGPARFRVTAMGR